MTFHDSLTVPDKSCHSKILVYLTGLFDQRIYLSKSGISRFLNDNFYQERLGNHEKSS